MPAKASITYTCEAICDGCGKIDHRYWARQEIGTRELWIDFFDNMNDIRKLPYGWFVSNVSYNEVLCPECTRTRIKDICDF